MTETQTTCAWCGVGCGVVVRNAEPSGGASVLGDAAAAGAAAFDVEGDLAHPANHGRLCSKGKALADTLAMSGRLLHPRIDGRDAGWDEALALLAERFLATRAEHGPDSIAFYVSGQLLTEDYYVANKLMKGFLGSANIDTNSRLCMSSAVVAHQKAFGEDTAAGCYEDLELADLLVLVGSNTAWCHPVLFRRIEEARRRRHDMRIVVIDPRRTPTAELADLHLPIRSGTDTLLFDGLLVRLAAEGRSDTDFLAKHTAGARDALEAAAASAPDIETVARGCGLPAALVERFYKMFARTPRTVTAWSQGANQSSAGTAKALSIVNVHLLTGRIGKPGMGPLSLTGQPNAMGGREAGGLATMLAAHLDFVDAAHRDLVRGFWKSPGIASRPGRKAVDLFDAVHAGRIKALWIMATNPAVSLPNADKVRDAIASCDFVVVSDCMADTDTTRLAQVLLPAATWGERDGTTTNSERRISRQRAFVAAPGVARPDWWIVCEAARRMGFGDAFDYAGPHEIFDEHARLSALANHGVRGFDIGGLAGLTREEYDALAPVQWPVPSRGHAGTPRLFGDGRFFHGDGRARLVPTPFEAPAHATDDRFPLVLNSGRIRDQWHTMSRTGAVARLADHRPEPFVEIHPGDAAAHGVGDGDLVRVGTRWGSAVLRAHLDDGAPQGSVFAPIHWSDATASAARVGALVSPAVDPHSGEPEFKHTPASIVRADVDWHGVLFARSMPTAPDVFWWCRVQGSGFVRYEMAGFAGDLDWLARDRRSLGLDVRRAGLLEYVDASTGVYRGAVVAGGRLEACLFVSPGLALPSRAWIAGLFAKASLGEADRLGLLAGRPIAGDFDSSPVVCSCFGVHRSAIERAIGNGACTPAEIGSSVRAGSNCGSCLPEIRALLACASAARAA